MLPESKTQTAMPSRQKGVALFMALVILLVLTILGVFGMNMSRLENMMAGNNQFQATALSNAELAVSVAEQAMLASLGGTKPACYYVTTETIDPAIVNWDNDAAITPCDYIFANGDPTAAYVIEYANRGIDNDCSKAVGKGGGKAGCIHYDFVITAQADASRGAKRTVQTVYQAVSPP
jgi:Tfp pilus assembly protein PilX